MIGTIAAGLYVFCRVGSMLMTMPAFGSPAVPALARLCAAFPLALLLLPAGAAVAPPETLSQLVAGIVSELLLGVAMGTVVNLAFGAIGIAAELLAAQGGMHMAAMFDPLTLSQPGALGALATWLGIGVFIGADLHLACIAAMGESLRAVPPGAIADPTASAAILGPATGAALGAGVTLAGPLTVLVFTINLGLSILTRMAPNLQLFFAVGPSFTVMGALAVLGLTLPSLLTAWASTLPEAIEAAYRLAELAGRRQ